MASCCFCNINILSVSRSPLRSNFAFPHLSSALPNSFSPTFPPSASAASSLGSRSPKSPFPLCRAAEYVFPDPIPEFAEAVSYLFTFFNYILYIYGRKRKLTDFCIQFQASVSDGILGFQETNKFRAHLIERLTKKKKDLFGDSIEEVVRVCTEVSLFCCLPFLSCKHLAFEFL